MPEIRLTLPRPHAGQLKMIAEAKRFNVACMGRRFGKTTLGIDRLIGLALQGFPAAWFAPTYKLLAEVWRVAISTLTPVIKSSNEQEKRIELLTGGVVEFWSLDGPDPARGRKYKRVIIDEAGIVRNLQVAWQEAIRPTLTDFKGDAWFLGTPKGRGFFHQIFTKGETGEPGWMSWRMGTVTNPHIDPAEVEAARRDLPPGVFEQEYLGIPADDGGNPFGLSAIRECVTPGLAPGPAVVFGVDLAKSCDYTVVCGMNAAAEVCVLDRWQSDWGQTLRRILDTIGGTPALVDSTGVGDPIVEQLQRANPDPSDPFGAFPSVYGFKYSAGSKQQLMEGLAASVQRREIRFPAGWLTAEMEAFQYEYRPGGVRYSAPVGLTDDGVNALALCNRRRQELAGAAVALMGAPPLIV